MINSINHHNYSLKIILMFLSLLLSLDDFKFSVSGQFSGIGSQSSIIINDKLYLFGGYSKLSSGETNQTIYLDLSTSASSFPLDQSLSIKVLTPTSTVSVPPFICASLALGGSNNDTLSYKWL